MKVLGMTTTTWFQVLDEDGTPFRRFMTMQEAENFAQESWTIEKISITKTLFQVEEAPF